MTNNSKKKFVWRAFVSVLTAVSFVGMTFSGVILFLVPPGRIANWSGWTLMALTKDQWIALHLWFSLIFVMVAVCHLWLNWKYFVSYFKDKVRKTFALRCEWTAALILCMVVLVATLVDVRPFSSLSDWQESIKYSWDEPRRRGPVPHAELMTLAELSTYVQGVDVDRMLANLASQGIEAASGDAVVGELADTHNVTPQQIYNIAVGQQNSGRGRGGGGQGLGGGRGRGELGSGVHLEEITEGQNEHTASSDRGFGQMTVSQYCDEMGLDKATAIQRLQSAGFGGSVDTTIRQIADEASVHPSEIRRILHDAK